VLERAESKAFHDVILERITVEEKMEEILTLLQTENRTLAFHLLFPAEAPRRPHCHFVAVLELVKMSRIRLFQLAPFETIRISPCEALAVGASQNG